MPERVRREDLADTFKVLGSTTRLDILARLRVPSSVADLAVPAARSRPDEQPGRPIASATAREHLAKLVAAGLVVEQRGTHGVQYHVNRLRLYSLSESFRSFAAIPVDAAQEVDHTRQLGSPLAAPNMSGPRVVLVHGAYEGRVYPLVGDDAERWTIGRRKGLEVSLDYDPYVSRVHAYLEPRAGGHAIVDATGSQNGTRVNWTLIPKGEPHPLAPGDVISVGRSLLVYAR